MPSLRKIIERVRSGLSAMQLPRAHGETVDRPRTGVDLLAAALSHRPLPEPIPETAKTSDDRDPVFAPGDVAHDRGRNRETIANGDDTATPSLESKDATDAAPELGDSNGRADPSMDR